MVIYTYILLYMKHTLVVWLSVVALSGFGDHTEELSSCKKDVRVGDDIWDIHLVV